MRNDFSLTRVSNGTLSKTKVVDSTIDVVKSFVEADRHLTVDEIGPKIGKGVGSVHSTLFEKLRFRKVPTRWVLRLHTEQ